MQKTITFCSGPPFAQSCLILAALALGLAQLARGGGEPDLDGVRVAFQDHAPAVPSGAMTFVDDDDAEAVGLRIVSGQESGDILGVVVEPERLIGRDLDPGVAGAVLAAIGGDDPRGVLEDIAQLAEGLLAELVAIAEKERWLGEAPGLI